MPCAMLRDTHRLVYRWRARLIQNVPPQSEFHVAPLNDHAIPKRIVRVSITVQVDVCVVYGVGEIETTVIAAVIGE